MRIMRFMPIACSLALVCACAILTVRESRAEILEPPPESAEGADYEAEPADSVDDSSVELSVSAAGRPGAPPRETRRVRFSSDSLGGSFREGQADALAGGSIEGRGAGGAFGVGRLAPRWGRGLVMGAPADPWSVNALDRGPGARFRGRSGDGAWYRGGESLRYEAMLGRFDRRPLGGVVTGRGPVDLGLIGDGKRSGHASAALDRERVGMELAFDRSGRWRAETALQHTLDDATVDARVRIGHEGFRSLAEPRRSGPAQALTVSVREFASPAAIRMLGSLWRFHAGAAGARAALEGEHRFPSLGVIALGAEEQHGVRREAQVIGSHGDFRQGWWAEWQGSAPGVALQIRCEGWGAARWARDPVRTLTTVRAAAPLARGVDVRVTHSTYRVRSGESLYVPEAESDRLVLRALTGAGERSRIEIRIPLGGGRVETGLALSRNAGRASRAQWNLAWIKRTRLRRG